MMLIPPFNLLAWIAGNRHLLKPPVGNKLLFQHGEFIVMAVGGPNARKDYHHDPSEELFFQLEGGIVLKIMENGHPSEISIREGELFLLPPEIPHSPQRPAGSIGLVVERRRRPDEQDGFSWYCENCGHLLYLERVAVRNLETQLPSIFSHFYSSLAHRTCGNCGTVCDRPD